MVIHLDAKRVNIKSSIAVMSHIRGRILSTTVAQGTFGTGFVVDIRYIVTKFPVHFPLQMFLAVANFLRNGFHLDDNPPPVVHRILHTLHSVWVVIADDGHPHP